MDAALLRGYRGHIVADAYSGHDEGLGCGHSR
jgi:hypothetical protein